MIGGLQIIFHRLDQIAALGTLHPVRHPCPYAITLEDCGNQDAIARPRYPTAAVLLLV